MHTPLTDGHKTEKSTQFIIIAGGHKQKQEAYLRIKDLLLRLSKDLKQWCDIKNEEIKSFINIMLPALQSSLR